MKFWIVVGTKYDSELQPLFNDGFTLYHSKEVAIDIVKSYRGRYKAWELRSCMMNKPLGVQEIEICSDRLILLMLQFGTDAAMSKVRLALREGYEADYGIIKQSLILIEVEP